MDEPTPHSRPLTLHPGLWSSIENSVSDIEILLVRADQGITVLAMLVALWFTTVRPSVAWPLVALCVVVFALFTGAHWMLMRRKAVRLLRAIVPGLEISIGGISFLLMATLEGPAYALGSWVPPQLFCLFIAGSILRMQPGVPVTLGLLAAAQFQAVYWMVLAPVVQGDGVLLHQADVQFVRAGSLVLAGLTGTAAIFGLKRMMRRAQAEDRARDLFGKYRLVREIASGGMGLVYEALYCPEGGFQRRVAVKLIHPHLAEDEEFVEKFREEARLSALLAHPNLVAALDFGRVDQTYFLAMEYVDGPTLWELHHRRRKAGIPMEPGLVAMLGSEIAEGLHFAHAVARGPDGRLMRVVHRDLSPANVVVTGTGQVKLLDFGVARAMADATKVRTMNLVGKPSYLSPEQLEDSVGDERSDLWSLAVVLWELLCNTRLFKRETEAATLLAVVQDSVPQPSSVRDGVEAVWDAFFLRALNRDPALRFGTAQEFRNTLRAIAEDYGVSEPGALAALVGQHLSPPEDLIEELELDD